ncbi:MAG: hypothetical protein ACXWVJ_02330 [Caulobacteraceae bacterium]
MVQIVTAAPPELPDALLSVPARRPQLVAMPIFASPVIGRAALFSPGRTSSGGEGGQSAGISLAGVLTSRGFASALVRGPDGKTVAVRPGQSVAGWRLAGVGADAVVLTRGSERLRLGVQQAADTAPQAEQAGEAETSYEDDQ